MNDGVALIITALVALLGGIFLTRVFFQLSLRIRLMRQIKKGRQGEARARVHLLKHGFKIIAEQPHLQRSIEVDGTVLTFSIRADFLVQKGGRRGIVDAKNGRLVKNPVHADTRRQLLEYAHYYHVDDVYLFDAVEGKLRRLLFAPSPRRTVSTVVNWLTPLMLGMAAGAVVTYLTMLR